jgi:rubredoxin
MAKYVCTVCQWVYDEEKEGKKFEDLADDWVCPICGVKKEMFEPEN